MTNAHTPPDLLQRTILHLFGEDGGYHFSPDDEHKFGITRRAYPGVNIAGLTLDTATFLHRRDLWDANHCNDLPPALAVWLFDAALMHRPKAAVRLLQMALRITADGHLGPRTVAAAHAAARLSSYPDTLALAFAHRADFIHDLITADSRQARHALGWFRRLFGLQRFIAELAHE